MGVGGYLSADFSRDKVRVEALRLGIELGMTFIDTAEAYGDGHSEELVAEAANGIRDKVFIATKFSPEHNSYNDVIKSAEGSLRRLKTDYIDLYQLHWSNPGVPLAETMRAMEKLRAEGKIRYIGVCNLSLKELKEARAVISGNDIASIQMEYNLFDRTIENDILPYCESESVTTIAYSPLDQGKIAGGDRKIKALHNIAEKYNRTMAQVTLNWLVSHPSVVAIPKATSPDHIRQNAVSADFELTSVDYEEINRLFARECVYVPVDRVRVSTEGEGNRRVYQTVAEAMENKLGFVPSPADLARDIQDGEVLKPVRVIKSTDKTGQYDYDVVEGRLRYWAWVVAHGGEKPVPVLIREN